MSKDQNNATVPSPSSIIKPSTSSTQRLGLNSRQTPSKVQFSQQSARPPPVPLSVARRPSSSTSTAKKKMRIDVGSPSMERNFITVDRAMADFLLTQDDLEGLERTSRRSPYANSPEIMVLSRKDVVHRSNMKWGSPEKLIEELQKQIHHASKNASGIGLRRLPRDERRRRGDGQSREHGLCGASGRVVVAAIAMNGGCLILKLVAWYHTRSHSMFSEFLHSVADTANQIILAIGVYTSTKRPSVIHPYGYTNMRFVSALISGVGIFCVGTGLSLYHGFTGLAAHDFSPPHLYWAFVVMGISGLLEAITLSMAIRSVRSQAKKKKMPVSVYVLTCQDPSVNVVLTEDMGAVASLLVASTCLFLSDRTGSHVPDAIGSLLVGVVLGAVAVFIIKTSAERLVGRSIPKDTLQEMTSALEADVMVRAIHDVKGIDMGNNMVRYKAELDFDGRQLARAYLDQINMTQLQASIKEIRTMEELEEFMLDHGENLVDMIGGQIDRIETNLKVAFPSLRHCDLEIL